MRREFQREIYKLESTDKKLNRDLKRAIDKKESVVCFFSLRQQKRQQHKQF